MTACDVFSEDGGGNHRWPLVKLTELAATINREGETDG